MYAVFIFLYTKSIRVIPVKWVLNFDKKNIEENKSKVCYYYKNLENLQILRKPYSKGFAERKRRVV
jgi:hypothetical protein